MTKDFMGLEPVPGNSTNILLILHPYEIWIERSIFIISISQVIKTCVRIINGTCGGALELFFGIDVSHTHQPIWSRKKWPTSIPNNQYQATASQVFMDCCEKCVKKCDKNSVITINIYTNVKFKILVSMRVENIVVLPSVFLYISSYMK